MANTQNRINKSEEFSVADKHGNIAIEHFESLDAAERMTVHMDEKHPEYAPFRVEAEQIESKEADKFWKEFNSVKIEIKESDKEIKSLRDELYHLQRRAEKYSETGYEEGVDIDSDKITRISERLEKIERKEYKRELTEEARQVIKLPLSARTEHYNMAEQEWGKEHAMALVAEVKKQRRLSQEIER